jgi:sugar-specific transcriptional regulator TrmB
MTLVSIGEANGKTIWKCSGVARQDIYRVLTELQEKGLVEKTLAKPTDFKAIPIQEGLEILLTRKNVEFKDIEKKTKELEERIRNDQNITKSQNETSQFYLVPSKEASLRKRKKCIGSTQKSLDISTSWRRFLQITSTQIDDLLAASNRGVKLRWVVSKTEKETSPKIIQECIQKLSCEIRYHFPITTELSEAALAVFDGKEVLVVTDPDQTFFLDSEMLWSNSLPIASLMQHYFNLLWEKATEHDIHRI